MGSQKFNRPSEKILDPRAMRVLLHPKFQILLAIVCAYAVLVVYELAFAKGTSELFLHDPVMLGALLAVATLYSVPGVMDVTAFLLRLVGARPAAVDAPVKADGIAVALRPKQPSSRVYFAAVFAFEGRRFDSFCHVFLMPFLARECSGGYMNCDPYNIPKET